MTTQFAKAGETERKWYVIDADGIALGRVATEAARLLRGKHKPIYTPNVDAGDFVIVVNAAKVILTGHKAEQKLYRWHSGYPGGLKSMTYKKLMAQRPQRAMEHAVKGMLPRNKLGAALYRKLKVYSGETHPHQAQKPETWAMKLK
ncbi:MAG: 50S ribosomal protein L13 [Gracilibacteraceae bacterium]|jgi:large subunit ribosomal protein L13|nr:50S ribosomal protein L13 [Gracilibacteraceae bacterium]